MLSAFAQRLLLCVRENDTVARLGGDEFVVLSENLASREEAATPAAALSTQTTTHTATRRPGDRAGLGLGADVDVRVQKRA